MAVHCTGCKMAVHCTGCKMAVHCTGCLVYSVSGTGQSSKSDQREISKYNKWDFTIWNYSGF